MTAVSARCLAIMILLAGTLAGWAPLVIAKPVVLRLRWDHQFQFAGYYAAHWQNFYEEEGLQVEIRSAFDSDGSFHSPIREVASGDAHFGVGGADILKARDSGNDLVVLAAVMQQSPVAFYALGDTQLESPADLVGLRVATLGPGSIANVELRAMLRAEHIDPDLVDIRKIKEKLGLYDLAKRHADVVAGYTISAQWVAQELGMRLKQIRPASYGTDFYGSAIFTHRRHLKNDPDMVERFTAASLRGWEYALTHPEEIADRISREFARTIPIRDIRGFNRFQIDPVTRLTSFPIVELGHINPARWQLMHDALKEAGQVSGELDLQALIYDPEQRTRAWQAWFQRVLIWVVGALSTIAVVGFLSIAVLRRTVASRTQALAESETRYRNLIEGSIQGILIHQRLRPKFVNRAYAEIFGYESPREILEMDSIAQLYHPQDLARITAEVNAARAQGRPIPNQVHYRAYRKDGRELQIESEIRDVIWDGEPAVQGSIRDITERIQLEGQLRQAQKMEAVGQMAGGVAHDFNNMLHIIQAYAEQALRRIAAGTTREIEGDIKKILHAASSSSELTRQLLAFSRRQVLKLGRMEINDMVQNVVTMLLRLIGDDIEVRVDTSPMAGQVLGDRAMLEQVVVNLCVNARDAMPDGGNLTIATEVFNANPDYCARHNWSKVGNYAVISVSDTGSGISAENMQQVFEPFFTTKEVGKGTGLGLSVAYGIVQQHQGYLTVDSTVGAGSTFRLFLPQSSYAGRPTGVDQIKVDTPRATETILVAEDEPDVLQLTITILEDMGYKTVVAADGVQACDVFDAHADSINLALLDVMMPKRPGKAVYEHIRLKRPGMPIVFSSGYTADAIDDSILSAANVYLLQKPYSFDSLLEILRQALNGHNAR